MNSTRARAHTRVVRCMSYMIHNSTCHQDYGAFTIILSPLTITIFVMRIWSVCFKTRLTSEGCKKGKGEALIILLVVFLDYGGCNAPRLLIFIVIMKKEAC